MTKDSVKVLSIDVNVVTLNEVIKRIANNINFRLGGYVCVSNVHMCMEALDELDFQRIVNSAMLVVPDGRPIYWMQRLAGCKKGCEQVRGEQLMAALCELSAKNSLKIGLYGGSSPAVLEQVKTALCDRFVGLQIPYAFSPPYRPLTIDEDVEQIKSMRQSGIDLLFVGIGCPKQEKWMSAHQNDLDCTMIGVGAAYDLIAKIKPHAPKWIQVLGLEWCFRLILDPRRLWKRYLIQNPRFIFHLLRQCLHSQ